MRATNPNSNPMMPTDVRYAVPSGYRTQNVPPVANLNQERFSNIATGVYPPVNQIRPAQYPPNAAFNGSYPNQMRPPFPGTGREQVRPPEPYYYNPNGNFPNRNSQSPAPSNLTTSTARRGAKEYTDKAFMIKPDGAEGETIRGLVSNDDINKLLTHKGTQVKVAKIYRITKTKSDAVVAESSDEELPTIPPLAPAPPVQNEVPPSVEKPRSRSRSRSSSSSSCCSTCSCSSCSSCRSYRRPHSYDDCPECQAERQRRRERRTRRR